MRYDMGRKSVHLFGVSRRASALHFQSPRNTFNHDTVPRNYLSSCENPQGKSVLGENSRNDHSQFWGSQLKVSRMTLQDCHTDSYRIGLPFEWVFKYLCIQWEYDSLRLRNTIPWTLRHAHPLSPLWSTRKNLSWLSFPRNRKRLSIFPQNCKRMHATDPKTRWHNSI